jgi:hypothetical protein
LTMASLSSPARVAETCNDIAFEAVFDCCDLAASYALSAREAAWRGDRRLLAGHLAQLRACVVTALDAHRRLGPTPEAERHG